MSAIPVTDTYLEDVELFRAMTPDELACVRRTATRVWLDHGQWLFRQGDPAERFYLVRGGHVRLFRLSADGNEKVIEIVRPGQTFAEAVPFMREQRYPVNAAALGTTELIGISNATFRNVLQTSTEACFRLMADMSQRLHRRLGEIDALTLQNATYRMVNYLLALPDPGADAPGGTIHLSVPKGVLASRLSITQETFSRILHNLAREGLIEVRGAAIRIRDPEGLRAFGRD